MTSGRALTMALALGACSPPAPAPPASSAPAPAASSPPAPAASSGAEPTASVTATAPAPRGHPAPRAPIGPLLFNYQEAGDHVEFFPPRMTRITRTDGQRCMGELPEDGNMYSGAEVASAFAHADVKKALLTGQTYAADVAGTLTAPRYPGSLTWATSCRGCLPAPAGVSQLHDVLVVVMRNRRLLCP